MDIFEEICSKMDSSKVKDTSETFCNLKNDEERVNFSVQLLKDYDLLPLSFNSNTQGLKSVSLCVRVRSEGNEAFKNGDYTTALLYYTKSIAYAPCSVGQEESIDANKNEDEKTVALSLAFANRSAVLYKMRKYELCQSDIDLAFNYHYPKKLAYKLYDRKARSLNMMGRIKEAHENVKNALNSLSEAETLTEEKKVILEHELKKLCSTFDKLTCKEKESVCSESKYEFDSAIPKISYSPNLTIPCSSNCVEIKSYEDMDRGLYATRDIEIGDILAVETPFASILLDKFYYTHCYHCYVKCSTLLPCFHCAQVMFCSKKCRDSSWERNHHIDCKVLPHIHKLKIDKIGILALRIVILATTRHKSLLKLHEVVKSYNQNHKELNENGQYDSLDYRTIYHLVTNVEKRTVANLFKKSVIAACILNCLEKETNLFSVSNEIVDGAPAVVDNLKSFALKNFVGGLLLKHLQNLPCNAHEITYAQNNGGVLEPCEVGAAAYATMSLINHSCDPNVVRHSYDGDKVVLRAIRRISKGEQIFDNYGYHYATSAQTERRSGLLDHYFFTCNCTACMNNWPIYNKLTECNPMLKCQGCHQQLLESTECAKELLQCAKCNHVNNISRMKVELSTLSKCFSVDLQCLISGNEGDYVNKFICYLTIFDRYVVRPWKNYNDCQEALKHCFLKLTSQHKVN